MSDNPIDRAEEALKELRGIYQKYAQSICPHDDVYYYPWSHVKGSTTLEDGLEVRCKKCQPAYAGDGLGRFTKDEVARILRDHALRTAPPPGLEARLEERM